MAKQDITKSFDRLTCSDDRSTGESSSLSMNTLRLAAKCQPRVMKLDLITLPQFNVTNIARCLSVSERLQVMTTIHPRLSNFVYHPQCFPDMSFFPIDDREQHDPKILSSNGSCGITYVEINIFSKHPFVEVALMAGMWNFRADLWDSLRWPHDVNIESLQLTLDHGTDQAEVHLDCPPGSHLPGSPPLPQLSISSPQSHSNTVANNTHNCDNDEDQIMHSVDDIMGINLGVHVRGHRSPRNRMDGSSHNDQRHQIRSPRNIRPRSAGDVGHRGQRHKGEERSDFTISRSERSLDHSKCVSPTTRRPMDLFCRLRNLFFIRFESPRQHPIIYFPRTLWGLGLQSFNSSTFSKSWWRNQLENEQRFEGLRFLVLSCCSFSDDELQMLLASCPNLEHLSMRYVQWEGTIQFPASLLSLGYFPDKEESGCYSLDRCSRLWQISTRLNENEQEAVQFLNRCSTMSTIKRVKFEFIRKPNFSDPSVQMDGMHTWEREDDTKFTVAVEHDDLELFPDLKELFPVKEEQFVEMDTIRFDDCPFWSDESMEFIHMTTKRKLLLR